MSFQPEVLTKRKSTDFSTLYQISTTSRISKSRIIKINILEAIKDILQHPQPLSLRMCSYLLKGIVKAYAIKLKYYENEIYKYSKPKREKIQKQFQRLTTLKNICNYELNDKEIENLLKNYICDNNTSIEQPIEQEIHMDILDNSITLSTLSPLGSSIKIENIQLDTITELGEKELEVKKYKKEKEEKPLEYIFQLVNKKLENINIEVRREQESIQYTDISGSISYQGEITTTNDNNIYDEYNLTSGSFNKQVEYKSRFEKAMLFSTLLENAHKNTMKVEQKIPYGEIIIKEVNL
ncbi:hypothetical protein SLOPH_2305 [Spraguea lophii 42_110]|uniref:Rad21/Rec8-like protein N-terminal domain-containing protein n=1 Tax=Spraguea lophii (strain 42_110) TaxID=1358809 RepID=S7W5Q9_SPRLO|nr:hypothetical protein SLOPH_2305 [Spraguea lophii 42_110]